MTLLEVRPAAGAAVARRSRWLLAVLLLGQFMVILDSQIVNVAAPTVRADLRASGAGLQLVIVGYVIAYAVLLIPFARLGGLVGPARAFLIGLAAFTGASLACGLAPSTGWLIAFRFVQGAGGALMIPQVLSLIQRTFQGAERARALGFYSAVIAGGSVVGQVLGGVLVTANLLGTGWRPVFLVNVPVGLALLLLGSRILPTDAQRGGRLAGLDLPGLVVLVGTVLALVVPLVLGREERWPVWGWVLLAAVPPAFAVFVAVERRAAVPLVAGSVLRAPGMLPAVGAIFTSMATFGGLMFAVALHLQSGLRFSALHAGLSFVPSCAGFALLSLNWRRIPARWHRAMIPSGYLLAGASYLGLGAFAGTAGWPFEVALALVGVGLGAAFSPLLTRALHHVDPSLSGDASGLLVTVNQLGQVVGVATFGTLYLTLAGRGSAHALVPTTIALGVTLAASAASALLMPRER
jgi:MFS family permease